MCIVNKELEMAKWYHAKLINHGGDSYLGAFYRAPVIKKSHNEGEVIVHGVKHAIKHMKVEDAKKHFAIVCPVRDEDQKKVEEDYLHYLYD